MRFPFLNMLCLLKRIQFLESPQHHSHILTLPFQQVQAMARRASSVSANRPWVSTLTHHKQRLLNADGSELFRIEWRAFTGQPRALVYVAHGRKWRARARARERVCVVSPAWSGHTSLSLILSSDT